MVRYTKTPSGYLKHSQVTGLFFDSLLSILHCLAISSTVDQYYSLHNHAQFTPQDYYGLQQRPFLPCSAFHCFSSSSAHRHQGTEHPAVRSRSRSPPQYHGSRPLGFPLPEMNTRLLYLSHLGAVVG
jgi:hypothetical protein